MFRGRAAAPLFVVAVVTAPALLAVPARVATTRKVKVILSEFIVQPKPERVRPGRMAFDAQDVGVETHELVVVRAGSPARCPRMPTARSTRSRSPRPTKIGEIEDIEPPKTAKATFRLKAGKYVLFCNIVEEDPATGELESHFAKGMFKAFTVKKS